jgi:formate dehydrogenase subunit beta
MDNTWTRVPGQEGNPLSALRQLLADLLKKGLVDAVLVPRPAPGGDNLVQALVKRPGSLADADPVAPVMPVQSARLVSALTVGGAPYRLGAVLKACELRATIELAKLKQVNLDGVLLIGVDCLGTYEVPDYAALVAAGHDPSAHALAGAAVGTVAPLPGAEFRVACQMCEQPLPEGAGLSVALLGLGGDVLISGAADVLETLAYEAATPPPAREEAVAALVSRRSAARDRLLAEWTGRVGDPGALLAEFSRCIRCHNCMVSCPLCYCKECLFRTATFDHEPQQYEGWLERHGALRLPADTLLFHLTRLNHMVASCVGCGACSSACPSHLPVATMFRAVGREVQALFDYTPGRSLEDELPVAAFREDELQAVAK